MENKQLIWLGKACIVITTVAFLGSCTITGRRHHDGPPAFYVDESKIPNAQPKPERLARYGNMPYYYVFGKRYHTLHSSKNFQQTGIASWYGTKFHAQRTSSGEKYDMLSMTAAHKSLPLPTYIEVTNLNNHRKIIVKVNDRGPFEANRILDLSYVAAKKLGMLGHGTARVHIRAIDPYQYLAQQHKLQPHKPIFIQAGAFNEIYAAEQLKLQLEKLKLAKVTINFTDLYRVQLGPFTSRTTALAIKHKLHAVGVNSTLA